MIGPFNVTVPVLWKKIFFPYFDSGQDFHDSSFMIMDKKRRFCLFFPVRCSNVVNTYLVLSSQPEGTLLILVSVVLDEVKSLEWLHISFKLQDTTNLKNIFCFLGIMIHFKKFRLQEKLKALKWKSSQGIHTVYETPIYSVLAYGSNQLLKHWMYYLFQQRNFKEQVHKLEIIVVCQ